MIQEGDFVRVAGFASTRDYRLLLLTNLLLPDGEELLVRGNSRPRWSTDAERRAASAFDPDKIAQAKASAEGIFRVWTWGRATPGWWFFGGPETFPLTEAGLATLEGYDEYEDNPVLKCIPPGMPATMGNPYPIIFEDKGDSIEYRSEEFDIVRTIYLDAESDADVAPSPLGYSVGRWDDENTLLVETTRINAPYFNRVGVRQTEDVVVNERFTLEEGGQKLSYEISVTDANILTQTYQYTGHWVWAPGEEVGKYECAVVE